MTDEETITAALTAAGIHVEHVDLTPGTVADYDADRRVLTISNSADVDERIWALTEVQEALS
jgi:hypothetical protein